MRYVVRMTFSSPISIGAGDVAQGDGFHGIVHSDTLFSAIANEWARTFEDKMPLETLVENLNGPNMPFRISSAFPFFSGDYYIPTPLGTSTIYREKLREFSLLNLFDFIELAAGNENYLRKKKIDDPLTGIVFPFFTPRVAIDRFTAATNIYQTSGYRINPSGGLFFILEVNNESILDKLLLCIRLLGESGLGGERSVGYGRFTMEVSEADQIPGWRELFTQTNDKTGCWYSLSLCCPRDQDEAREALSYNLFIRKGWILSNSSLKQMKRRQCRMFGEGSLFRKDFKGLVVDVTPDDFVKTHKVYRYGVGFNLYIRSL